MSGTLRRPMDATMQQGFHTAAPRSRARTLAYSMIQAAVDQRVMENGDLDWKEELPNSRNPRASEEFAKEVAAMVNGWGGMIVFRIAENRESSAAERIVLIEAWSDASERKLRSWAYSLIQPPVHGLKFRALSEGPARILGS